MVEVITITKFKSKNGLTYETHDLAKKADDEYAFSMCDMGATEVKNYEKEFDMYMKRLTSLVETNRTSFPMFWRLIGKHTSENFMANSYDQIEEIGMAMFSTNYQYYISDDEKTRSIAKNIMDNSNKKAAYAFVWERSNKGYEYEDVEKFTVTTFG